VLASWLSFGRYCPVDARAAFGSRKGEEPNVRIKNVTGSASGDRAIHGDAGARYQQSGNWVRVLTHLIGIIGIAVVPAYLFWRFFITTVAYGVGGNMDGFRDEIDPITTLLTVDAVVSALAVWVFTIIASTQRRFVGGITWSVLAIPVLAIAILLRFVGHYPN
jgi:hypothetical protein